MPQTLITTLPKPDLRAHVRILRAQMDTATPSPQIVANLRSLPELRPARSVLLYLAMPGEIDIESLTDDAETHWYAPRCLPKRRLGIYRYVVGKTPLTISDRHMRQPDPNACEPHPLDVLDAVIVPGLLFTTNGDRLGQGGGYYDRFLPILRPNCLRIGVAPNNCIVRNVPCDDWDVPMDIIVTETQIFRTRRRTVFPNPANTATSVATMRL